MKICEEVKIHWKHDNFNEFCDFTIFSEGDEHPYSGVLSRIQKKHTVTLKPHLQNRPRAQNECPMNFYKNRL